MTTEIYMHFGRPPAVRVDVQPYGTHVLEIKEQRDCGGDAVHCFFDGIAGIKAVHAALAEWLEAVEAEDVEEAREERSVEDGEAVGFSVRVA